MDKLNIEVFIEDLCNNVSITDEYNKLIKFTKTENNRKRKHFKPVIKKLNDSYVYFHNGKNYPFTILSEDTSKKVLPYDIKALKSDERHYDYLFRTLKYACTLDLVNPKIIVGTSKADYLEIIASYYENGKEKVFDYSKNLIMNKDDYYDLFKLKEINVLDKYDLYIINSIMIDFNDNKHLLEYLLFSKEIFKDIGKKSFKIIDTKYDKEGINYRSYTLLGNNCDYYFFQHIDSKNKYNSNIIDELDRFTETKEESEYINYDSSNNSYSFIYDNRIVFKFKLLSDTVTNDEIKENLLSNRRYHECHENSIIVASLLEDNDRDNAYIVGGRVQVNKQDKFLHSWVEIKDKNLVLDYNHNIIMNKDTYYKLFYAIPISKTQFYDYYNYYMTTVEFGFNLHPTFINYFGKELYDSLEKNKHLIKK